MALLERRRHSRFPTVSGFMNPIEIEFDPRDKAKSRKVPAILRNLGGGGMAVKMYSDTPAAREVEMRFSLPGCRGCLVRAKVLWVRKRGPGRTVGLAFTRIAADARRRIRRIAGDFQDCSVRIAKGVPEPCVPACVYKTICLRPQRTGNGRGLAD